MDPSWIADSKALQKASLSARQPSHVVVSSQSSPASILPTPTLAPFGTTPLRTPQAAWDQFAGNERTMPPRAHSETRSFIGQSASLKQAAQSKFLPTHSKGMQPGGQHFGKPALQSEHHQQHHGRLVTEILPYVYCVY